MPTVKVRFPPSPTGYCHVGTARMALVNYLFAKKTGGTIVFRSEDTDRERSTKEYEEDIIASLKWLGISWDQFYRQSERLPRHISAIEQLLEKDKAYLSREESKRQPGTMIDVVRLRNPGRSITFSDVLRGDITFDTAELGDFPIARAKDDPLYHLAVVVDDAEMGITHVIRGEEHISNTPRQILIGEALGYQRPVYAHYPLFLSAERAKLSKRKGDVAVRDYRAQGYLPEALLNFIGTLGWTPPSGREVLSLQEMIEEFELADLHTSGAVFDIEKLRWFNRQYIERMHDEDFSAYALPILSTALTERAFPPNNEAIVPMLIPLVRERIAVAADIEALVASGELDFAFKNPSLDATHVPEKRSNAQEARTHLEWLSEQLAKLPQTEWSAESVKGAVWDYANATGRGAVLWPMRYALSGRQKSPDPFTIAGIIGKARTLERLSAARDLLSV